MHVEIGDVVRIVKDECGAPVGTEVVVTDIEENGDVLYSWRDQNGWVSGYFVPVLQK